MIVLTGASGGLGKACFQKFSELDFTIGIYNSSPIPCFPNSSVVKVDICSENSVVNFVNDHLAGAKQIVLINMATASIDGLVASFSLSDWKHTFDVNLSGSFLLVKHLLPLMIKNKWGRIVHISSHVGVTGEVGAAAYCASKSAISGFSRSLAKEYGRYNISSNVLELGYFNAGLIETLSADRQEEIRQKIPSKKFGDPIEVVEAVRYFMASRYVNGATIKIDGGI